MAQRFNDGTSGDVNIRSGPPASGGGWGGGSGGGNRVGASGSFGGVSSKTKALRKAANKAREEKAAKGKADAAALAQEQARIQSRQQLLAALAQRHSTFSTELDRSFTAKAEQLTQSLEHEISGARRHHDGQHSERWQLYLITKDKNEIDGLITQKTAQLNDRNAIAAAFDGHDPLTRTADDYLTRLEQFGDALQSGHQLWEAAYNAAHEARLLSTQLDALHDKSNVLAAHHAEQSIVWREREALWDVIDSTPSNVTRGFDSSNRLTKMLASNGAGRPTPFNYLPHRQRFLPGYCPATASNGLTYKSW
ncbi:hypothetical protein ACYZT9_15990 [Pseudomonas sp. ZT5P21]